MKTCYIIDDNVVVLTGGAISTIAAWKSGLITPGEPADAKKLADFIQLQYELRRTGALYRDVQKANRTQNSIEVGNTLHYSVFVHEGTYKMGGRGYMRDSLTTNQAAQQIANAALRELKKE